MIYIPFIQGLMCFIAGILATVECKQDDISDEPVYLTIAALLLLGAVGIGTFGTWIVLGAQ